MPKLTTRVSLIMLVGLRLRMAKIGILSDAHGNGEALILSINLLRDHGADKIFFWEIRSAICLARNLSAF